ncbi:hypothetical protein [Nocardia rosealba]|uniref:hypothetical protein n=1 Tax=Nocardia rosealba TaxID=2878563 RepID=UPI001CDA30E6|nr:hypothetical protein [Nocardia rosealba]MCA2208298.1 hypothetical protein [Nocardia rosealba]
MVSAIRVFRSACSAVEVYLAVSACETEPWVVQRRVVGATGVIEAIPVVVSLRVVVSACVVAAARSIQSAFVVEPTPPVVRHLESRLMTEAACVAEAT